MTEKSHAERGCDYCHTEKDVDWYNNYMNVRICKSKKCHEVHDEEFARGLADMQVAEDYARDMGSPWY